MNFKYCINLYIPCNIKTESWICGIRTIRILICIFPTNKLITSIRMCSNYH